MEQRPIEGPEPYKPYLDGREAGAWLGNIGESLFESLMATHLPTVRPVYLGKYKVWQWMDVAMLNHILGRGITAPPGRGRNSSPDETTEPG